MKDFAKDWRQRAWESAADTHKRMQEWIVQFPQHPRMVEHAKATITKLEAKYPSLKIPPL
jgi:hypothetical protein